jgi:hypothetical protein
MPEERKVVTSLFTDLVGSAVMAEGRPVLATSA